MNHPVMISFSRLFFSLIVLLTACSPQPPASAATPTRANPTVSPAVTATPTPEPFPDAYASTQALGRGVNMGNALEAPKEGEWGVYLQKKNFDLIKQAGFQSVRIPISWNAHAAEDAPYSIDPVFLARVDTVVNWAVSNDLQVILDFHNYPQLMSDPDGQSERYLAIWQQLSAHYQDYSGSVLFELLNEPNGKLDAVRWNTLSMQSLRLVRELNPSRNVIIGGAIWNSYDQLQFLELPPTDRHIIATFHYYNPFPFTHQGAEWAEGMDQHLGTTWEASAAEKAAITADFDLVSAWSKAHDRPVLLGEFGAYSKADMDSRARWTAFVAREAEKHAFAWSYWEFCAGFGIYDPVARTWRQPLLKALIP